MKHGNVPQTLFIFLSLLCTSPFLIQARSQHSFGGLSTRRTARAAAFVSPTSLRRPRQVRPNRSQHFSTDTSQVTEVVVVDDPSSILSQDQVDAVSDLVRRRGEARWNGDYEQADALRNELQSFLPADNEYSIAMQDVPRKEGGGSTWSLVHNVTLAGLDGTTVLQLAHAALGLAIASSEGGVLVDDNQLNTLINETKNRLLQTPAVTLELRGRKAADAAFWFALAGVSSDHMMLNELATIAANELDRFGARDSCRAKDVWQIVDRFTAAGLRHHDELQRAAEAALVAKERPSKVSLDFHSDRCLLMIWKFSTRQRKQRVFLEMARNHWLRENEGALSDASSTSVSPTVVEEDVNSATIDWSQIYDDPTKPLVVDIGCGMGVSLLGLAQETKEMPGVSSTTWSDCNFAGVDLSGLAINYAQCLGKGWKLDDRLHFFFDSAERFVEKVASTYPGPIELCMVQFPTPYRLPTIVVTNDEEASSSASDDSKGGNGQLPSSATEGFMVSESLLKLIHKTVAPHAGKLLIQSNCEDVAVWMQNTAVDQCHFEALDMPKSENEEETTNEDEVVVSPTKRTLDWVAMGGERAEGHGWSDGAVLPRKGRTETEVACMLNGTPVHRCLLKAKLDP